MRRLSGTFIGFCGAGGTGKTTTAKLLAPHIGYQYLPSAARDVFQKMGFRSEDQQDTMTPDQRWNLQQSIQIAFMEQMAHHFGERVVNDRTQMDQYAYALQYCSDTLSVLDLKWLHDLVERALQFYKVIFYFPLVDFDMNDGMRTNKPGRRLAFDCMLHGVLNNFNIPTITVPILNPQERVEFIQNYLGPNKFTTPPTHVEDRTDPPLPPLPDRGPKPRQ